MSEGKKDVVVLTGAGSIGLAIARRVGAENILSWLTCIWKMRKWL